MELHLVDTKTGARTVSLSPEAARVLAGIPRTEGNPWVIQGRKKGERPRFVDTHVRERAKLRDVRLHDFRHSFASRALALGESLPVIGKLLAMPMSKPPRGMRIWRGTPCTRRRRGSPKASQPTSCESA